MNRKFIFTLLAFFTLHFSFFTQNVSAQTEARLMRFPTVYDSREIIINLKSFSPGVYFIKLQLNDGSWEVRRFVKE